MGTSYTACGVRNCFEGSMEAHIAKVGSYVQILLTPEIRRETTGMRNEPSITATRLRDFGALAEPEVPMLEGPPQPRC